MKKRGRLLALLLALACLSGCGVLGQMEQVLHTSTSELEQAPERTLLPVAAEEKTEEELYALLLEGICAREARIAGLGCDAELVKSAARAVWSEHPELFWYAGGGTATTSTFGDLVTDVSFAPDYAYDEQEIAPYQASLDAVCTAAREELGEGSDYEKTKGVYEYVIEQVEYSGDIDDQDIVASLIHGAGVCGAYARAMQYLLQSLGVDCRYVHGETARGSHAWNLVCMDGDWYHVDATWGDPSYNGDAADYGVSYAYLGLTDEQILRSRTISDDQMLPACTAQTWNYYRASGLYLEQYDYGAYLALYASVLLAGQREVSVMFGSEKAFCAASEDLLEGQRLLQVQSDAQTLYGLPQAEGLHYVRDETLYLLTVLPE